MIAKTLRRRLAVGTALSLAFVATPALAQLVSSGDLVGATDSAGNPGQISISNPNATTANISVLAPAVIANWTRFNAPDGTTVNITNASAGSEAALLNRVIGGTFSDLGGTINATGVNLWVLNSNGILFGGNTSVNAKSFHASTLGVTDADFFDFYEGTDNAGNGSATINFSGAGSTAIVSPAGASFTTDGTLLFAGPSLGLSGDFDAGSGRAVFVSATNFSINNSPGSPLTYTISAGTTVAGMLVGGTVQGQSADFLHVTAAGVVGALLQVDADVATTAIATDRGILLGALSVGAPQPDFVANGSLTTSGAVLTSLSGDATFNDAVTGASVGLAGVDVTTQAVTATAGDIDIDGSSISTGLLQASDDIFVDSSGAISLAGASADNDASGAGSLRIGNGSSPVSVTVTGAAQGASVDIFSNGDAILGNVTSTAGLIDIDAGGGLNAGAISANGGNASVTAAGGIVATSIGSTGNLDIDSTGGGNLSVGNLTAGMEIALDTSGTVTGGTVNAGGMLTVGASTVPGAATFTGNIIADGVDIQASGNLNLQGVTSTGGMIDLDSSFGAISAGAVSATGSASLTAFLGITTTSTSSGAAIDIDSTGGGNLSLGNLNAGATIALDTAGTAALGAATAGGAFNVGASIDPSTLTIAGNVSAGSVDFDVTGALVANSITATAGDIDIDAGSVAADFITATDDVFVDSTGAVTLSGAQADSDSSGAGNLAIGATTAPASVTVAGGSLQGVAVTVQGVGDFYFGSSPVTSTGGAVELDSATGEIVAGVVSATGGNASLTAGGRLFLGNVTAGADVTFDTPGSLDFGNVSAGGTFAIGGTLVPFFVSATGVVNAATLTSNTTGGLSLDGANSIASLGNITAGGVLSINSITDLALGGLVSAPGQYISIRSAGDLTVNAGGRVVGRLIAFSAADNFINNRGADAITASDHWVV